MGRKFFAIIDLDEKVAEEYAETNGIDYEAPGAYLEREFGWLEQSGISLDHWMITDEDDELKWARYINYLILWACEHSNADYYDGMSPACYDEWSGCEDGLDEGE